MFSCVGTALHDVCECMIGEQYFASKFGNAFVFDQEKYEQRFDVVFRMELRKLHDAEREKDPDFTVDSSSKRKMLELREQGKNIIPEILPAIKKHLGSNLQVYGHETKLYEPMEGHEKFFMGFVDLVLIDDEGVVHIIDFKTCSWGWNAKKKSGKRTTYQPTFYKHFFSTKFGIPFDKIKCHFVLLKRTGKEDQRVEFVEVKIGKKKVSNALKLLDDALSAIKTGHHPQNWKSCHSEARYGPCPFIGTEHCVRTSMKSKTLGERLLEKKKG